MLKTWHPQEKEIWRPLICLICEGAACRRQITTHYYMSSKEPTQKAIPLCYWCFKGLEHCGRLNIVEVNVFLRFESYYKPPQMYLNINESYDREESGQRVMAISYERFGKPVDERFELVIKSSIGVCIHKFIVDSILVISREKTSRLSLLAPEILEMICEYV